MQIKQKPQLHASWIDPHAKEIVRVLQREGFTSYLVGGCVRDLLAGFHPKDYDIATDALPNQVKRKVWGSYVIGKRFRLVLAKRGDQQYEIATFRRDAPAENPEIEAEIEEAESKMAVVNPEMLSSASDLEEQEQKIDLEDSKPAIEKLPPREDNFFGTPEQDALRRDFTINALFYDPVKDELIDFIQGIPDIKSQMIRMIGDPDKRIQEDPIRIFRAIRLSHKLGFKIEPELRAAIAKNASTVAQSVLPRRREEFLKLLRLSDPIPAFLELYDLGVLHYSLPGIVPIFSDPNRFETFRVYLQNLERFCENPQVPSDLLTPFILGFIRSMDQNSETESLLSKMMKDELMIFKSEQAAIFGGIDMINNLSSVESFKKRGQRRQQAFLQNENLPLALRIAKADFLLNPALIQFWQDRIKQLPSS